MLYKNDSTLVLNFMFATVWEPLPMLYCLVFQFPKTRKSQLWSRWLPTTIPTSFVLWMVLRKHTTQASKKQWSLLSCALLWERKSRNVHRQVPAGRWCMVKPKRRRTPRLRYLGRSNLGKSVCNIIHSPLWAILSCWCLMRHGSWSLLVGPNCHFRISTRIAFSHRNLSKRQG